jgi:hypothetical protein
LPSLPSPFSNNPLSPVEPPGFGKRLTPIIICICSTLTTPHLLALLRATPHLLALLRAVPATNPALLLLRGHPRFFATCTIIISLSLSPCFICYLLPTLICHISPQLILNVVSSMQLLCCEFPASPFPPHTRSFYTHAHYPNPSLHLFPCYPPYLSYPYVCPPTLTFCCPLTSVLGKRA